MKERRDDRTFLRQTLEDLWAPAVALAGVVASVWALVA